MTGTMVQLPHTLATLVESRLDTIDRMLVGRVPRQDRLAIAREVESQIYDLLEASGHDDHTRESVLAVLARLDPPEAYLPDEAAREPASTGLSVSPRYRVTPQPEPRNRHTGRASGILGLISIVLLLLTPLPYLVGLLLQSEIVILFGWGVEIVGVLATGIAGIVLGICGRFQGAWAVFGVVACASCLVAMLVGSAILLALIVGGVF